MENKRNAKLISEICNIRELQSKTNGVISIDSENLDCPSIIVIIKVPSIIHRNGKTAPEFKLKIDLPKDINKPPRCKVISKAKPFHPHFTQVDCFGLIGGDWVDYKLECFKENLSDLVLRIARSLAFHDDAICIEQKKNGGKIANKKALETYYLLKSSGFSFPLETRLPVNLSESTFSKVSSNSSLIKKFEVQSETKPYEPIEQLLPQYTTILGHDSKTSPSLKHDRYLYLSRKAFANIGKHIGWNNTRPENSVEQGGILIGKVFYDSKLKIIYAIVEDAIPGVAARGSNTYLEMDHHTWKNMLDKADIILNQNKDTTNVIIGWYHTHPNSLDVFMSGTDMATQQRLFSHDWQFAIVLNPHRTIWKAFSGSQAVECKGQILDTEMIIPDEKRQ